MHIEKVTHGAGNLGSHIDREKGKEFSYSTADPSLTKFNTSYDLNSSGYKDMPLQKAISLCIGKHRTATKAIRKDAVVGLSIVLSGTKDTIDDLWDKDRGNEWVRANMDFIKKEFGEENVVRFVLHLDELTPHIHAVIVPLTSDGRLTAKETLGNRIKMSQRQTRYADHMKQFGLERGIVGSKAVHNTEGEYLAKQKEGHEAILKAVPDFKLSDRINPESYIKNITNKLKSSATEVLNAKLELGRRSIQIDTLKDELEEIKEELDEIKEELDEANDEIKELALDRLILSGNANGLKVPSEYETRLKDLMKIAVEFVKTQGEQKLARDKEEKENKKWVKKEMKKYKPSKEQKTEKGKRINPS